MIKTKYNYEDITSLNSYISKILKKNFGKGPASCYTFLTDEMMFINIKNFITPVEEVLIKKNEEHLAHKSRMIIFDAIFEQIQEEVKRVLNIEYTSMCYDWSFKHNTGLIILTKDEHFTQTAEHSLEGNESVDTIRKICSNVHNTQVQINHVSQTSTVTYIIYSGFMSKIEHALYEKGYVELLIEWSNELKDEYKQNKRLFEQALRAAIDDHFVFLDFEKDRGMIVFYHT